MRPDCEAILMTCDDGTIIAFTNSITIQVIGAQPEFYKAVPCGQPAVDHYDAFSVENGQLRDISIHLCAEHWDQNKQDDLG